MGNYTTSTLSSQCNCWGAAMAISSKIFASSRAMPLRHSTLALRNNETLPTSLLSPPTPGFVAGPRHLCLTASWACASTGKDSSEAFARTYAEEGPTGEFLGSSSYTQWDSITGQLAGSATLAFLLLQLPQIFLNAQNLSGGNPLALFAVPWMGQLTGLLGNLSLLSYFAKKKETGAMVVQAVGVISTFVVLTQLTLAGAMPQTAFVGTATAVGLGLLLNFFNYKGLLSPKLWGVWEDAITVGGLSVLPQVMWSTFDPVLPPSMFPGTAALTIAMGLIILRRAGKLPSHLSSLLGSVSAWTATLLFMWAPVAQMWTNYINPANIQGLSVFTVLLAMLGNGLLLPRALFTRDLMWFTGASWGTLLQGWAILVTMYLNHCIGDSAFWGASAALAIWLGVVLTKDSKANALPSPLSPLKELLSGESHVQTKVL